MHNFLSHAFLRALPGSVRIYADSCPKVFDWLAMKLLTSFVGSEPPALNSRQIDHSVSYTGQSQVLCQIVCPEQI